MSAVTELKRPGHEEIKAIVRAVDEMTASWADADYTEQYDAYVRMFDAGLADKLKDMFHAGKQVRAYLEWRGL